MTLLEQIRRFTPIDEQEEKDKEYFLYALKNIRDVLTRKSEYIHFTASAFCINQSATRWLAVNHNIYKALIYPGGHADGVDNLFYRASKEISEETSASVVPLTDRILSIQSLPTIGHYKKGIYVPAHTHLDVVFLFQGDDTLPLRNNEEENSSAFWVPTENASDSSVVDFARPVNAKNLKKIKNCLF